MQALSSERLGPSSSQPVLHARKDKWIPLKLLHSWAEQLAPASKSIRGGIIKLQKANFHSPPPQFVLLFPAGSAIWEEKRLRGFLGTTYCKLLGSESTATFGDFSCCISWNSMEGAVQPGAGCSSLALILSTSPRMDRDVHKLMGRRPDTPAALSCGRDPYRSIGHMLERWELPTSEMPQCGFPRLTDK